MEEVGIFMKKILHSFSAIVLKVPAFFFFSYLTNNLKISWKLCKKLDFGTQFYHKTAVFLNFTLLNIWSHTHNERNKFLKNHYVKFHRCKLYKFINFRCFVLTPTYCSPFSPLSLVILCSKDTPCEIRLIL